MSRGARASEVRGETTQSMPVYEGGGRDGAQGTHAGLVVLYAQYFEQFLPAYVLREGGLLIGRDPDADLRVPGKAVSRRHARVEEREGRWVLVDLGGRNGTLVNGEFVREVVLEHLDEIRVGDAIFKFVESDAEGHARHRIDGAVIEDPGSPPPRRQPGDEAIVGGYRIQRVAAALRRVAKSALSVLILGESGTGKEVLAAELHRASRRGGAFQAVNCAAIPAALIEGELFGARRGAFSGADRDRAGLIRSANGGTLFLDEIGDMPLEAQAKLLRVIQTKQVTPLGATEPERVDVRFVSATHRDLAALQKSGGFRGDLYARLNEYSLVLPPLRERKEDVYSLCLALAARHGRPDVSVSFPFMTALLHYDFPFNVRELESLVKRWAAVSTEPELETRHLTDAINDRMKTYGLHKEARDTAESAPPRRLGDAAAEDLGPGAPSEPRLRAILAEHRGYVSAVGRALKTNRVQVHRWINRYGIDVDAYR
ncbi:Flagellar regulatory protein FleQ [Minicystis rosea]|nr:Flagellar regulatory protein FleQ [Minicystis rosea]